MNKARLEAFSDGVIAIALSLAAPLGATAIYVLPALLWFLLDHHVGAARPD
ncbi:hypothetical protein [uncultured Herbaspirillum sp.]|uniref:hypothetical protein n=1 Tax=uncultured Herbaspirillum sp. TaxID=160236 RepID=UPI0026127FEA|nr:hypothetical protein [uncultured Herbaspirillum sp.]